jgi:hypothetical protein
MLAATARSTNPAYLAYEAYEAYEDHFPASASVRASTVASAL